MYGFCEKICLSSQVPLQKYWGKKCSRNMSFYMGPPEQVCKDFFKEI